MLEKNTIRRVHIRRQIPASSLLRRTILYMIVALASGGSSAAQASSAPARLRCDSLTTPLGIDSEAPDFSWQLRDTRFGARQTAYRIQVASSRARLRENKPDVWDSGKNESEQSVGVRYNGAKLEAEHRYFWRVSVWDQDGKPYPPSEIAWWETGLLNAEWKAKWIGYEETEHRRVREANATWITNPGTSNFEQAGDTHHAFRLRFTISKPVKRADLFVAGEDSASAWLNGQQVIEASPLSPWMKLPWKAYSRKDVSAELREGENLLAVDVVLYAKADDARSSNHSFAPMNATLYIENADGSVQIEKSEEGGWRSALDPKDNWQSPEFDDTSWQSALPYQAQNGAESVGHPWRTEPVKMLRRTFSVSKPVSSARLYATALGAYKFFLNGKAVGDQVLSPGWMDFREQVAYQVYDVTLLVNTGRNGIGALLAPGWYTTPLAWYGQGYNYGNTPPALLAQLRIEHTDGSIEWVTTDASWKAGVSPILSAEIYNGETYDARRAQPGWDTARFSDAKWQAAEIIEPPPALKIVAQTFPPIRVEKILSAKEVTSPKSGIYVYDFGQNLSGVARIEMQGAAGTNIQVRYGERLNPDGTLYTENLRSAKATDHFILAGRGTEEYQPAFTFHGFRYAEVTGVSSRPPLDAVRAVVFHTDAPFTVKLKTGNQMVNKLWANIEWGQRSNFVGVPTDCPQRDERLGWTGDAQVFWRTASYNMDLAAFSRKYAGDLRGTQVGTAMYGIYAPGLSTPNPGHATGWSDAGVIVPWTSWLQTGELAVIEQNWQAMERYLSAIETANPNHLWKNDYGIAFGDWLSPEGPTAEDLIATAYWAYDADLMRQMAHAIGRPADERRYADLVQKIKAAFNQAYVRPDGFVGAVPPPPVFPSGLARPLPTVAVDTQTGYVLALHMNLLPDALRSIVGKRLVDKIAANRWHLATGFLGTPYLLSALTDSGHADVAYRLLLNTDYPSWGYLVEHGATTMWERWNGDQVNDPSMNSFNHYAYGSVAEWIYRYAAGVDTIAPDPGFHTVLLHPNFDARLGSLDFAYESPYGTVHSAWRVTGSRAIWHLTIPPNSSGRLPLSRAEAERFKLKGEALSASRTLKSSAAGPESIYFIPAGAYTFEVELPVSPGAAN